MKISKSPIVYAGGYSNNRTQTLSSIQHDNRTVSAINIIVSDASRTESERVNLEVPSISVSSIMKKLEKLIAEEEFRRSTNEKFDLLTKREIQVLKMLGHGLNNLDISKELFISRRTVEQHHKNLNRKLSIRSYADLMRYVGAFDLT